MGPRERERRRPVFGSQELPPPRPPKPERAGGTLDRVRDFLDRAGFESPQDNRHRARSAEDSRRSTSEIRRVPRSRDSKRAHGDHCDESDPPVPPAPPAVPLAVPLPLPPPAPPSVPLPTPPPPPRPTHHSDRSLPSPPLRTRETQPKKKQRFLQPPPAPEARLPPAPPAPPPPAPPPAPPAWNDYEDNDYDGEYYEPWDDGYGPASPTWDDGYGAEPGAKVPTHLEYFSSDEEDESPDGEEASNSPALSYLPPPPPPPVPHDLQNFIPPPPQIPKGWGKGGKYGSRRKMASTHSPWFCNVCNKDLWNEEKYNTHVQDDHIPCPEEGCTFSGPEFVMAVHKLKHVKAADGSSVTDSPEELAAWRSMRKANFPSKGNLKRKAELEEKRRQSGALPDPPKVSMLEKLLRRTHQVERGKGFGGFGGFGYKGFGKKGKFKGKGKDGKGKEGKGKDWKGKDGKGKGKTSGKKGKGKSKWSVERDGEPERRLDHATYSVPLPSVVANCVPLEAPFGGAPTSQVIPPSLPKWGPCRFFDRGFCFHGENCQYEHVGAGAMTQKVINSTAWWALPSSLANRAGRPGEGPAGGVFTSLRSRPLVATRVEPYVGAEQRERRDGLLRRLLQPDVERYYSAILQCVRYIVSTDFLRLERPHVERPMEPSVSQRDIQAELDAELLKEDLDDVDMSALHAALNQSE